MSFLIFYSPALWAQCSFDIQSNIKSGWNKQGVQYDARKNNIKIKADSDSKNDTDSIYLGSIKGCRTLTVNILNISGNYPWGGKVIGFSFSNVPIEPHQWGNQASFPPPRGHTIEDGFIKSVLSNNMKLIYVLDNIKNTTHVGAKVFIGENNALDLEFSATENADKPQFSARKPLHHSESDEANIVYQEDDRAMSCASTCHASGDRHSEYFLAPEFSLQSRATCPSRNH